MPYPRRFLALRTLDGPEECFIARCVHDPNNRAGSGTLHRTLGGVSA